MKKVIISMFLAWSIISCVKEVDNIEKHASTEVRSLIDFDNSCSLSVHPILGDCYIPITLYDSIEINGCFFKYSFQVRQCVIKSVPITNLFQVEPFVFTGLSGGNCQNFINHIVYLLTTNQYEMVQELLGSINDLIQHQIEDFFGQTIETHFSQSFYSCDSQIAPVIETEFRKENCYIWNITNNLPYKNICGESCCLSMIRYCLDENIELVKEHLGTIEIGSCNDLKRCKAICK